LFVVKTKNHIQPALGLLAHAFEHMSTAALIFGADHALRAMNSAAETMLEVSARQAVGMTASKIFPAPSQCIELVRKALQRKAVVSEGALAVHLPDGRTVRADFAVTPLNEPDGGTGFVIELLDVERRLQVTHEEQLLAQNEAARVVVRGLAHEIRNPLGGLRGAAQLLSREFDEPSVAEYTSIIIAEADRLQALLERMLGPRKPPRNEPVNVHEIIERVRALVEAEAPQGVEVERDYDPSIPDLTGDYDMLIQALLNIARNAVQALQGKGKLRIRTRVRRNAHVGTSRHRLVAQIDMIDNGPGIPDALQASLFYPLVTGRADGTGLGLSVAQSLIAHHGGLIECNSMPGETCFSVLLPIPQ
jgi:two-component system nitrogen regulation sensor histidine kinase GlnL